MQSEDDADSVKRCAAWARDVGLRNHNSRSGRRSGRQTVSLPRATGESRLDSPTTPPRCDGRGYDRGFRNRRAARCDSLGHDSGLRYRRADDTDSSYACWS